MRLNLTTENIESFLFNADILALINNISTYIASVNDHKILEIYRERFSVLSKQLPQLKTGWENKVEPVDKLSLFSSLIENVNKIVDTANWENRYHGDFVQRKFFSFFMQHIPSFKKIMESQEAQSMCKRLQKEDEKDPEEEQLYNKLREERFNRYGRR